MNRISLDWVGIQEGILIWYCLMLPVFWFFKDCVKTRVGAKLAACEFSNLYYTHQLEKKRSLYLMKERNYINVWLGEISRGNIRDQLEGYFFQVSVWFSSRELQNILGLEGSRVYCQSCCDQSARYIKELEVKIRLSKAFPCFCLLPSPRHIFC